MQSGCLERLRVRCSRDLPLLTCRLPQQEAVRQEPPRAAPSVQDFATPDSLLAQLRKAMLYARKRLLTVPLIDPPFHIRLIDTEPPCLGVSLSSFHILFRTNQTQPRLRLSRLMSKRGPKRSSGGKIKFQEGRSAVGSRDARFEERTNSSTGGTLTSILGKCSMSLPQLLPRSGDAGPPVGTGTSTRKILAGIKRRKEAGSKRRRRMTAGAGIVVVFSALCAVLLWVGVGSFSQLPATATAGFSASSAKGRGAEVCAPIFSSLR